MNINNKIKFAFIIFITAFKTITANQNSNTIITPSADININIQYLNSNKCSDVNKIKNNLNQDFKPFTNQYFNSDSIYWLKLDITNKSNKKKDLVLHFKNTLSKLDTYQYINDSLINHQISGVLIPKSKSTNNNDFKDNILISIPKNKTTTLYINIENKLKYKNIGSYLTITNEQQHIKNIQKTKVKISFFSGCIGIIFIITIVLFLFSKSPIYLTYGIYITFIAFYLISKNNISIFPNHPIIELYLEWSIYVSQNIYFVFLSQIFKIEGANKNKNRSLSILLGSIPIIITIFFISLFNYNIAKILHYYYSLIFILTAFYFCVKFFMKSKLQTKLIFIGSIVMVFGAFIDIINANPNLPRTYGLKITFFQIGIFIELILFMIAIIYSFFNEIKLKHDIEKDQLKMQMEKLQKEKENILLKQEVDKTYRELASTSIRLTQKETLITDMMQKLSLLKDENTSKKELGNLISGLKQHLSNNSWTEFEYYFNQVNPDFYSALLKIHPNLTVNEKKICAYLKLNLNTKEIASISGKSINSIEVARTRLRKKLELKPYQNIYTYISNI